MDDQNPSPDSSSSSHPVGERYCRGRMRRHLVEKEAVACTGKKCQSCTAGVIADCVAVCCCPCGVVNILALAFVKLPWAVARRCIGGQRKRSSCRRVLEEKRRGCEGGDTDGIWGKGGVEEGKSDIALPCGGDGEVSNDHFGPEEVWLELYEIGHWGFGRVSFTGIPFPDKGN